MSLFISIIWPNLNWALDLGKFIKRIFYLQQWQTSWGKDRTPIEVLRKNPVWFLLPSQLTCQPSRDSGMSPPLGNGSWRSLSKEVWKLFTKGSTVFNQEVIGYCSPPPSTQPTQRMSIFIVLHKELHSDITFCKGCPILHFCFAESALYPYAM